MRRRVEEGEKKGFGVKRRREREGRGVWSEEEEGEGGQRGLE